mmetsp:Transcript_15217/g.47494  ORF Transcript_15217/g.47494 Transcript_15217/m.47494 type:complete len:208 (-) Transcript_15217:960-1583(-)
MHHWEGKHGKSCSGQKLTRQPSRQTAPTRTACTRLALLACSPALRHFDRHFAACTLSTCQLQLAKGGSLVRPNMGRPRLLVYSVGPRLLQQLRRLGRSRLLPTSTSSLASFATWLFFVPPLRGTFPLTLTCSHTLTIAYRLVPAGDAASSMHWLTSCALLTRYASGPTIRCVSSPSTGGACPAAGQARFSVACAVSQCRRSVASLTR